MNYPICKHITQWPTVLLVVRAAFFAVIVGRLSGPVHAQINVNVHASNVLYTLSDYGIGTMTAQYYNNIHHPSVPGILNSIGLNTLRFGGGGYADMYHWSVAKSPFWENPITGAGMSPFWGQSGNYGYIGPNSDFPFFVNLLDQIDNARAVVTVNYGSAMKMSQNPNGSRFMDIPDYGGQPQEAAAWVAYANTDPAIYGTANDIAIGVDQQGNDWKTAGYWAKLRASTVAQYRAWAQADGVYDEFNEFLAMNRSEPVGITHWEIGNETFGDGYYSGGTGYNPNYAVQYSGDNSHRNGHPDLSPQRYAQDVVTYSQLMKSIDPTIKIGAVLSTPPNDWNWDYKGDINDPNNHWNPIVLSIAAEHIDFGIVHWYPWSPNSNGITLLQQPAQIIPAMIDGQGNRQGANAGVRDWFAQYGIPDAEIWITEFGYMGSQPSDPAVAVFVADSYATWFNHGVTSVQYHELFTEQLLIDSGGVISVGPAFYAIQMINEWISPGDELVETDSSSASLRVHASVQEDGTVAMLLLNRSTFAANNININIDGLDITGDGWLLTGNGIADPTVAALSGLGNQFNISSIPGRTMQLYLLEALSTMPLPGDFNGDGVVDAADYVLWRKGLGAKYTPDHYDEWRTHFGQFAGSGASLSSPFNAPVPEPSVPGLLLICLATLSIRRPACATWPAAAGVRGSIWT